MRLIDADALDFGECKGGVLNGTMFINFDDVVKVLNNAPAIDAVPVVHGEWTPHVVDERKGTMSIDKDVCSVCGKDFLQIRETGCVWNYCPNCGAKMDGGRRHDRQHP